ncbi:MAG: hypothetical protein [Caudoviricetes sp.]|nr:MAG: hypothetical protein [Caudoviricetes sp.]
MTVSILSKTQKEMLVKMWNNGSVTKSAVARHFGVSPQTASRVIAEAAKAKPVVKVATVSVADAKATLAARARDASGRFVPKTAPIAKSKPVAISAPVAVAPIKWLMGPNFINLIQDGHTFTADASHASFEQVKALLVKSSVLTGEDAQVVLRQALQAINVKQAVLTFMKGNIKIVGDVVTYKDLEIDSGLTQRIIDAMKAGKKFDFLLAFFENLMLNPSRRAVNELYGFLAHNDIELTEDGHFLAWKRVNANYTDMYTGKISNKPGQVVEVPRNQVDEDSSRTCSAGLHVAAKSYLPHYGGGRGVIVQVKVHPRDVVSIPADYNDAKMRTCRYEVMKDVTSGFSHY